MTLIQKIADIMNAEETAPHREEKRNPGKTVHKMNSIEIRTNLILAILNALMGLKYSGKNCKVLQLFIQDNQPILALSAILEDPGFEQELRLQLINAGIRLGQSWQWQYFFKQEPPPVSTFLEDGLWLSLQGESRLTGSRARIKAAFGKLTSEEFLIEEDGHQYNIGRGALPRLDNGTTHQNHIIIAGDDFEGITPGELETNRYVSRAHASIICEPGKGFALKVLAGGTPFKNNRTRILRAGREPVDANNTAIVYPLENGDQIELGKNVILDFTIIDA